MVDDKKQLTDLGYWKDANFDKTFQDIGGRGSDEGLPDEVRFISGVAKLIQRRLAMTRAKSDPALPAIFLLEPLAPPQTSVRKSTRVPMLDAARTAVNGRIWFVSPVVVTGHYVDLVDCEDDERFRIVTDELQLGNKPAVIFEPRTDVPHVRYYPEGLNFPEKVEVRNITGVNLSLERIFEVIDHVYHTRLVTPEAQPEAGSLWLDKKRWRPIKNAEAMVQLYLCIGLTTAFPTCTIRPEQTMVSGRLDLEIVESDPMDRSRETHHAILELKVLRSYGSTGESVSENEILEWIAKGVKQAAAYRDERGCLTSALCCFDMRRVSTGNKCFDNVLETAARLKVALKLWYIYATSEQYRDAITASDPLLSGI